MPSAIGSNNLASGWQWAKLKMAVRPMKMFIEMMRNQTSFLPQPSVIRCMVRAKLVLDHMEATIDRVPATEKVLMKSDS